MPKKYVPVNRRLSRNSTNTARKAAIAKRRELLLSLRQAGASYAEIVRANIGYNTVSAVSVDMKKILTQFTYETPEDVLVLDLARLDELQKLLTAAFRNGDLTQAGPIMRVMQFRRETLGITQEQIAERQMSKNQIQNNGIMVIQGSSTRDYIEAMAQAAGASPQELQRELESVSESNRIIDAEIVDDVVRDDSKTFESRLMKSAALNDIRDEKSSVIPAIDDSESLLNIDIVDEVNVIDFPIKPYDNNVQLTSGIPYRKAPQKLNDEQSEKVVKVRLRKVKNANSKTDRVYHKTVTEEI